MALWPFKTSIKTENFENFRNQNQKSNQNQSVSHTLELNANALDKYNIFTIYYSDIGRTNYVGRPIAYLCISGVT